MIARHGGASQRLALRLLDPRSPEVEPSWRALEAQTNPPYFLSWGWIGNWLACLPPSEAPHLALVLAGDRPVAAGFLGRRRLVRHRVIPSRSIFLNVTGLPRWDELTLEHNALLLSPDARFTLTEFLDCLPGPWDELCLPALSRAGFPGNALDEPLDRYVVRVDGTSHAPFVDLEKVRKANGDYLGLLGPGSRAKIRRAQRGFGELAVELAANAREGIEIYEELVDLHARTWKARGQPGAFADPWFDAFHRRLIASRLDQGEIQLLRVRAGGATIGCLYNLVSGGRVLFYQSGVAAFDDPRLRPGLVCHAEAVRVNAASGHTVYDLLAGGLHYKRSLATDEAEMVWARIQRPLARFRAEERLRAWKRAMRRPRA